MLTVAGSLVSSQQGKASITSAQGDVNVTSVHNQKNLATGRTWTSKGVMSKTQSQHQYAHQSQTVAQSGVSGKTVEIRSQNGNATIKGSVVVSDNGTDIHGGKGVSIVNDVATFASQSHSASKKSGVMGTGGVGVSIGQLKQDSHQQSYQEQAVGSRVGITQAGDINITTDNHYQQTGSEVSIRKENEKGEAITGNISVKAKSGKVEAASQGYSTDSAYHMQQKGVTVALSIPVVEAVQAVGKAYQSAKMWGQVKTTALTR